MLFRAHKCVGRLSPHQCYHSAETGMAKSYSDSTKPEVAQGLPIPTAQRSEASVTLGASQPASPSIQDMVPTQTSMRGLKG